MRDHYQKHAVRRALLNFWPPNESTHRNLQRLGRAWTKTCKELVTPSSDWDGNTLLLSSNVW